MCSFFILKLLCYTYFTATIHFAVTIILWSQAQLFWCCGEEGEGGACGEALCSGWLVGSLRSTRHQHGGTPSPLGFDRSWAGHDWLLACYHPALTDWCGRRCWGPACTRRGGEAGTLLGAGFQCLHYLPHNFFSLLI